MQQIFVSRPIHTYYTRARTDCCDIISGGGYLPRHKVPAVSLIGQFRSSSQFPPSTHTHTHRPVVDDDEAPIELPGQLHEVVRVCPRPVPTERRNELRVLIIRVGREVRHRDIELGELVVGVCAERGKQRRNEVSRDGGYSIVRSLAHYSHTPGISLHARATCQLGKMRPPLGKLS